MGYWIDRERAMRTTDVVAIVRFRERRVRSRVVLRDNSWHHTLTRPGTCAAGLGAAAQRGIGMRMARGRT